MLVFLAAPAGAEVIPVDLSHCRIILRAEVQFQLKAPTPKLPYSAIRTNSGLGWYTPMNLQAKKELNQFLGQWLKNLIDQGHKLVQETQKEGG